MNINKVSLSEVEKNKENMPQQIQQKIVEELGNSKINLSTLLDKFHTDTDAYSLKHRLTEIGIKDPELFFERSLLLLCTLLLEGKSVSKEQNDILEEFNIDATDFALLNRLKEELQLDLIKGSKLGQNVLEGLRKTASSISAKQSANGRLEGKKLIPGHCAYNDSPSGLRFHGEDVVQYDLGDEYIPCDNHASSLELLNIVNTASIEELEKMYQDEGRKFWKRHYKDDIERYIIHLKNIILGENINISKMYANGDRFKVVKATYKDKEIKDGEYINCWYVDVCSEKTKKVYRVLSC